MHSPLLLLTRFQKSLGEELSQSKPLSTWSLPALSLGKLSLLFDCLSQLPIFPPFAALRSAIFVEPVIQHCLSCWPFCPGGLYVLFENSMGDLGKKAWHNQKLFYIGCSSSATGRWQRSGGHGNTCGAQGSKVAEALCCGAGWLATA